jgi:hypothetical protein
VRVHDLPLSVFKVEDVARAPFDGLPFPVDRLLHARPPDAAFFPCVDLVCRDEERAIELLELTSPYGTGLVPTPPLRWIRSDDHRAWVVRQPSEHRVAVTLRDGPCEPIDDAPDLLRGLHSAECRQSGGRAQPRLRESPRACPASSPNSRFSGSGGFERCPVRRRTGQSPPCDVAKALHPTDVVASAVLRDSGVSWRLSEVRCKPGAVPQR